MLVSVFKKTDYLSNTLKWEPRFLPLGGRGDHSPLLFLKWEANQERGGGDDTHMDLDSSMQKQDISNTGYCVLYR